MKNLKNKKGFTLVELLAVIVVLAIVMGIAAIAITNVLDSTRKNAYVSTAKQFIAGAKTLVNADEVDIMLGGTSLYTPVCKSGATNDEKTRKIYLTDIRTEGGDTDKSPYGLPITKGAVSYVQVVANYSSTTKSCTYEYSVFITDGVNSIGTDAAPIKETELDSNDVLPQPGYTPAA